MGHAVQPGQPDLQPEPAAAVVGTQVSATCTRTHYMEMSGGSTVTVPCSPEATLTVYDGSVTTSVAYSVSISPVTIGLGGTTADSSGNQYILVGQQCIASIGGIPGPLLSNTANPPVYKWKVTGTTFQGWSDTTPANFSSTGASTPGSAANPMASYYSTGFGTATSANLSWYWNDMSQTDETITCTVMLTPPAGEGSTFSVMATRTVMVYLPKIVTDTGTGASMIVDAKDTASGYKAGDIGLYAGPTPPGSMVWNLMVNTPQTPVAFGTGSIELVQTCTPNYSETTYATPPTPYSYAPGYGLDSGYPYGGAAEGMLYTDNDSPALDLVRPVEASASRSDSFNDYLMYQPPAVKIGSNSMYGVMFVPLANFNWSISANVKIPEVNNVYRRMYYAKVNGSNKAGTVSPSGTGNFTASNAFPSWTQINSYSPNP